MHIDVSSRAVGVRWRDLHPLGVRERAKTLLVLLALALAADVPQQEIDQRLATLGLRCRRPRLGGDVELAEQMCRAAARRETRLPRVPDSREPNVVRAGSASVHLMRRWKGVGVG